MVIESNSFNVTHFDFPSSRTSLLKLAWDPGRLDRRCELRRIGESRKPSCSWGPCYFDLVKQVRFLGCSHGAGKRARLANFNIVVEKWGSSMQLDRRQEGRPQGAAKG
jgi:hypothetical protein